MRSVAPESAGAAASQKSWLVDVLEAEAWQAHGDNAPDLPDGKGQEQRGHRDPQIELGNRFALALPEGLVFRCPDGEQTRLGGPAAWWWQT